MASLLEWAMDEKRRGDLSDAVKAAQNGDITPQQALVQYAQATGDPDAAKGALQALNLKNVIPNLDMSNPISAQKQLVTSGLASPDTLSSLALNPMMMMMGGGGNSNQPSALAQVGGSLPLLPWQTPNTTQPQPGAITATDLPPIAPNGQPSVAPQGNGQSGTPSSPQPSSYTPPNGLSPASPDDKRNYKYLTSLPPAMQGLVKGISEGDEQALNLASRSPMAIPLMSAVTQFDPSYSATNFTARNDMAQSMGKGKIYDFNNAANKAVQHSAQLLVAHNDQGNEDHTPIANWVVNNAGKAMGKNTLTNFDSVKSTFVPEMAKFTSGVGGSSDADRKELNGNFTGNMSDQQLTGALAKKVGMGVDAVNSTENNIRSVMGHAIPILTPENRSLANDIQNYAQFVKDGNKQSPEAQAVYARIKNAASTVQQPSAPPQQPAPAQASTAQQGWRPPTNGQQATQPNSQQAPNREALVAEAKRRGFK